MDADAGRLLAHPARAGHRQRWARRELADVPPVRDVLVRIKRAVLAGHYAFSEARIEMETDRLTESDVAESIINAVAIYKRLRSRSSLRPRRIEYLYVIQSINFEGIIVYSKGKLLTEGGEDRFYFLVSSKRAL